MKNFGLNIKEPTTRNAKLTFNDIENAAIKLFYENGYHGTTVGNITREAGIAAGTFYLYFPSKLTLYKHILTSFSHNIRREIAANVSKKDTRYEKEREGIRTFLEYAKKNPEMYNIIWESLYIDRELFREYYESFSERYVTGLEHAVSEGEIRDLDTEIVSFVLMGITNFVGLKIVLDLGEHKLDIDQATEVIMEIVEKGLFKQK
ncbi:MAG: TetR/AcrR family transcriptional regulator [Bacillota bacterium]